MSNFPIFDTHAHLQDPDFVDDLPDLLQKLKAEGVGRVVLPGSNLKDSERACELALKVPGLFVVIGVHPHDSKDWNEQSRERLINLYEKTEAQAKQLGRSRIVVGIGEIGLDYHYDFSPRDQQAKVYREQIEIAHELNLPIVIHEREAFQDSWNILEQAHKEGLIELPAACHCYSGSKESGERLIDLGFYLGFDGPITFKNAKRPAEVFTWVPEDRFLLETDSPYLTPHPFRGKRNDPSKLLWIEEKAAELKDLSGQEIRRLNWENASRFFRLPLETDKDVLI